MKLWWIIPVAVLGYVQAYSNGPPTSVCSSMTPDPSDHGSPTTSEVPYHIIFDGTSFKPNDKVVLSLTKIDANSPDFKGFMIEAIDQADNSITGHFEADASVKVMKCGSSNAGAVSHNGGSARKFANVTWVAPAVTSSRNIKFIFTVVQSRTTFWTKNSVTPIIKVDPAATSTQQTSSSSSTASTDPHAEPETEPEPESSPGTAAPATARHPDYDGCGTNKGCFGIEPDCTTNGNCKVMLTYQYNQAGKSFKMVLHGNSINPGNYIAAGFSSDDKMGDDVVFYCSNDAKSVGSSWNSGKSNIKLVNGVTPTETTVKTINGVTSCSFTLPESQALQPPTLSGLNKLELATSKYHLLLATGVLNGDKLEYHNDDRTPSDEAIDFKVSALVSGSAGSKLVQVHGCMMIFAWLACATSGMLMARYYKQTWRSVKPMGKDFWFRWHQLFMVLAVLLTLISFFVILAEKKGEPFHPDLLFVNPHAVIGIVCIILAVIQPVMAYFRPHPGTSNRWIFNWAHWFVGNSALLFGIVAIFLAVELPETQLDPTLTDAMIAYVVLHALAHLVLTVQRFYVTHNSSSVKDESAANDPNADATGSGLRKILFAIYFLFIWTFSIAFVIKIILAKK